MEDTLDYAPVATALADYLSRQGLKTTSEKDGRTGIFVEDAHTIGDLTAFFGEALGQPRLNDYLPQQESALPLPLADVSLEALALSKDDDGQIRLDFTLAWAGHEPELFGEMRLQSISAAFRLRGRAVSATLDAQLLVREATLQLELQLPGLIAFARLQKGGPAAGHQSLFQSFGSVLPGEVSKAQLQDIELQMALRSRRLLFHMQVADLLELEGVSLPALQLDLDYRGGLQGTLSGRAWGELDIPLAEEETLTILMEAQRGDDGAWQFAGGMGAHPVTIEALLESMEQGLSRSLPPSIRATQLLGLDLSLDTKSHTLTFDIAAELELVTGGPPADIALKVVSAGRGAEAERTVDGTITIAGRTFELLLDDSGQGQSLIALFKPQEALDLPQLVADLTSDGAARSLVPPLSVDVKDLLFTHEPGKSVFSLALALDSNFSLLDLPLLGDIAGGPAPGGGLGDLQLLYATAELSKDDVEAINSLLGDRAAALPAGGQEGPALNKGFNVAASLDLGDAGLDFSTAGSDAAVADAGTTPPAAQPDGGLSSSAPPAGGQWVDVQKKLGPLFLQKIGIRYEGGELWFLVDASLTVSGLTLALDGFGVSSPLQPFRPQFHLQGLGIDITEGELEIGGSFLHSSVTGPGGQTYDEYSGSLLVRTEDLALSAIGSYASLQGHPSFFAYLALDYPLGGPTFFFVTGLAAGFGYNRRLLPVPAEQVAQFPLVSQAQAGAGMGASSDPAARRERLTTQMQLLDQYIPPAMDEYFLAVGVSFTSFELIHGFVLVTANFGQDFVLNVLGTLSYSTPPDLEPGTPALVQAALGISATFDPGHGFLGVRAVLDASSYLFDPDCHLTGGMAFYSWFKGEHAGDFVLTMGGYHPRFQPPAHYPQVPRLGVSWQITDEMSVSGSTYFALTGHAFMAGGELQAVYHDGNLHAWLTAGADFLIQWKPYHYEAGIHVEVGASYTVHLFGTHTLSASLGAELQLWGPPFGGTVSVEFFFVSVDVSFGEDRQPPPPLVWQQFSQSFLPKQEEMIGVTARDGLLKVLQGYRMDANGDVGPSQVADDSHWLMNARTFAVAVDSAMPADHYQMDGNPVAAGAAFGISPMAVSPGGVTSALQVTIRRAEGEGWTEVVLAVHGSEDEDTELSLAPILKAVPAALWATVPRPDVNHSPLLPGAFTGFELRPQQPQRPEHSRSVPRRNLAFDTELVANAEFEPFRIALDGQRLLEVDDAAHDNLLAWFLPYEIIAGHDGRLEPEMLLAQPQAVGLPGRE